MTNARYYYRCADCLGVCTTSEQLKAFYNNRWSSGACGACGGQIEYMGRVERDRLVKDEFRTPCDARCTHAMGPSCDCRCGGANHGSGLWVEVKIDQGGIPTARMLNGLHLKRAAETYLRLVDAIKAHIRARYGAVIDRKCAGHYLDGTEYAHYQRGTKLTRDLHAAQAMRSHHGRNGKLRDLMKSNRIDEPPQTWSEAPAVIEWTNPKPATVRGAQTSMF